MVEHRKYKSSEPSFRQPESPCIGLQIEFTLEPLSLPFLPTDDAPQRRTEGEERHRRRPTERHEEQSAQPGDGDGQRLRLRGGAAAAAAAEEKGRQWRQRRQRQVGLRELRRQAEAGLARG